MFTTHLEIDPVTTLVLELLRVKGCLDAERLGELAVYLEQHPPFESPQMLGKYLVQQGWLTVYQCNQLFQGSGSSLMIGPYRILEAVGAGGGSQIFKAEHAQTKQIVALKVLRSDRLAEAEHVSRFQREFQVITHLSHPNIVRACSADFDGPVRYLALEFEDGTDLAQLVTLQGPLPVVQTCEYLRQVALGLQHIHEAGLVHRDIKPSNLMIAGRDGRVKILDLGIARLCSDSLLRNEAEDLTAPNAMIGSPDYLAPEQARDSRTADIRADIYSLGCTGYFALTGEVPFPNKSLMQKLLQHQREAPPSATLRQPEVPHELDVILQKMMAKQPDDRYRTPAEVVAALEPFCTGAVPTARRPNPPDVRKRPATATASDTTKTELLRPAQASKGPPRPRPSPRTDPSATTRTPVSPFVPVSPVTNAEVPVRNAPKAPIRILVAEDNSLNSEMLSRRLQRQGFEVICASNDREAVAQAQALHPDVILMDMSMPVLNGWGATRQLKANEATRSIPVIALTAHAMIGDREKALEAGCDDYEVKPVDVNRLLAKIQAFLDKRGVPAGAEPDSQELAVLVVDDNKLNCETLSRRLTKQGYGVTTAFSGREALALIDRKAFDVILLDIMMPEMSGLQVLESIRKNHSLLDLPVIAVTAVSQSEEIVAVLRRGANDYVTKPVDYPVLFARLETQLQLKQNRAATGPRTPAIPARRAPATGAASPNRASGKREEPVSASVGSSRPGSSAKLVGLATRNAPPEAEPASAEKNMSRSSKMTWSDIDIAATSPVFPPNYELLEELGRGGMGVVYKARHQQMNRLVALKVIAKEYLTEPGAIQRFQREIQAAAQLSHPNIVLAYDAGQYGDTFYYAMEYVDGVDLVKLVQESGRLPVAQACDYIRQAALGLQHAYEQGLVHRDIKPSNLLVTWPSPADNSRPVGKATVKIVDMGLALLRDNLGNQNEAISSLTREGRVLGTADYMAPEQWIHANKVDIRADLYSLGCTFYYLLTAQPPFPGGDPPEKMLKHHLDAPEPVEHLRPEVSSKAAFVLRRLLAKKPEQRYQQPSELADALR